MFFSHGMHGIHGDLLSAFIFFAHKLHELTQKYFFIAHELHKYDKFISCVACFSRNSYAELTLCQKNTPEREIQG